MHLLLRVWKGWNRFLTRPCDWVEDALNSDRQDLVIGTGLLVSGLVMGYGSWHTLDIRYPIYNGGHRLYQVALPVRFLLGGVLLVVAGWCVFFGVAALKVYRTEQRKRVRTHP